MKKNLRIDQFLNYDSWHIYSSTISTQFLFLQPFWLISIDLENFDFFREKNSRSLITKHCCRDFEQICGCFRRFKRTKNTISKAFFSNSNFFDIKLWSIRKLSRKAKEAINNKVSLSKNSFR